MLRKKPTGTVKRITVLLLVLLLLCACSEKEPNSAGDRTDSTKAAKYKVFFDGQSEGKFTAGEKVKVTYPLATDTDYSFSSDDVDFRQKYKDNEAVFTFTMPEHDVTIHVEARNTMEWPPEPGPTGYEEVCGTWYPEGMDSGQVLDIELDGSFTWTWYYTDSDEEHVTKGYLMYEDGEADWGIPGLIDGPRFEMYDDDDSFLNLALALEEEGVYAGMLTMLDGGGAFLFTREKPNPETMGEKMTVLYEEDFENKYGREVFAYTYEWDETYGTIVVFLPGGPLKDVSFLKLDDFTYENGISRFSVRELYSLERMDERQALYVELVFPGDTPHFGIAYTDESGTRHYEALEVSGMDGSLSLGAFEPTDAQKTAESLYRPVLQETYDLVRNGWDENADYSYLSSGLMESLMYPENRNLMESVGYLIEDISGDGIPELLIGETVDYDYDDKGEISFIYNAYTCRDGELVQIFEGWGRSSFQWMGDHNFYHYGSGGVSNSLFGRAHLSKDGTELVWDDVYLTDEVFPDGLGIFHNTTGSWDSAESEKLDITQDEFREIMNDMEDVCKIIPFTPIGAFE